MVAFVVVVLLVVVVLVVVVLVVVVIIGAVVVRSDVVLDVARNKIIVFQLHEYSFNLKLILT